jgi:hypothetical protein
MVVGFPQGGDNVCVTKGVVSRIDRQQYSHGRTSLLAIQVDAAINSGNSGGACDIWVGSAGLFVFFSTHHAFHRKLGDSTPIHRNPPPPQAPSCWAPTWWASPSNA